MTKQPVLWLAFSIIPLLLSCGKKSDTPKDVAEVERACESDPSSCPKLLKTYQEECDKGEFKSCNGLARMHFEGAFAPEDKDKAIELFERACIGGYTGACGNLGKIADMYAKGAGVPADTAKAAALYQKACSSGVSEACEAAKTLPSPASK